MNAGQLEPRAAALSDVATDTAAWTAADHAVREDTAEAIRRAVPANTTRAYTRQWAAFEAWCAAEGRLALPATAANLTEYTAALCRAGYAAASVQQAIAAIRVAHRRAGHPGTPDTQGAELVLADHRAGPRARGPAREAGQGLGHRRDPRHARALRPGHPGGPARPGDHHGGGEPDGPAQRAGRPGPR